MNKGQVLAQLVDANHRLSLENILEQWKETVARIDEADAELVKSEASLTKLVKNFSQLEKLYRKGDVSQGNFLEAKANRGMAEARVSQAKATRKASLSTLRDLQPQLFQARENFDNTKLIAPEDGFILSEEKEKGETVEVRTPIFTMSFGNTLEAKTCLPERLARKLSIGQNESAEVNGMPRKKYSGMIKEIGSSTTGVGSGIPLYVAFLETDGLMKPRMTAKITFDILPD